MTSRIAVLQMVSSRDVETSLGQARGLIEHAASQGVDAVFLPENFAALANADPRAIGDREVSEGGAIRSFLRGISAATGCWIFAGTLPISCRPDGSAVPDRRVRAASFVYDAKGAEVARYDKIHMFDVDVADNHKHYMESATFEPGDKVVLIDAPPGRVGLTVCYDIRFPELYRELFSRGARLFTIPSAFTEVTGAAHFEVLMRARAIENFSYTVAACQGGVHDSGRRTWGNSMVVDPWGEIIARAGTGEAVITAEVDLERLRQIREDMPVDRQRRKFD